MVGVLGDGRFTGLDDEQPDQIARTKVYFWLKGKTLFDVCGVVSAHPFQGTSRLRSLRLFFPVPLLEHDEHVGWQDVKSVSRD